MQCSEEENNSRVCTSGKIDKIWQWLLKGKLQVQDVNPSPEDLHTYAGRWKQRKARGLLPGKT